jgi:hypothetical protein
MAKPFSDDLPNKVARLFGVSTNCVIKLMRRYRASVRLQSFLLGP